MRAYLGAALLVNSQRPQRFLPLALPARATFLVVLLEAFLVAIGIVVFRHLASPLNASLAAALTAGPGCFCKATATRSCGRIEKTLECGGYQFSTCAGACAVPPPKLAISEELRRTLRRRRDLNAMPATFRFSTCDHLVRPAARLAGRVWTFIG